MKWIKTCFYDWSEQDWHDFPILPYPTTTSGDKEYSGYYSNQAINTYSDSKKTHAIGKINFSENYLVEKNVKTHEIQDYDQEVVQLVFDDGTIFFMGGQSTNQRTEGFYKDTTVHVRNILQGTGKYQFLKGYVTLQRLSLTNDLRMVKIYKEDERYQSKHHRR